MESLLQVVGVEERFSEKAGCSFKVVTFKGVKIIGHRELKTNITGTRNFWPTHEVEVNGQKTTIKGDVEYDTVFVGDLFDGMVFTCPTTPYVLGNNTVNSWKGVVLGHENPLVVAAKNLFQNNAAPIDTATGEVFTILKSKPVAKNDTSKEDIKKEGAETKAENQKPEVTENEPK